MTVFADTFALIAWLNPRDDSHASVTAYLDGFKGRLLTTEWVPVELADALSGPAARETAVAFLRAVRADELFEVVAHDQAVYQAGFRHFRHPPRQSLVPHRLYLFWSNGGARPDCGADS
jgi:predicted nucleic acid-binding protein